MTGDEALAEVVAWARSNVRLHWRTPAGDAETTVRCMTTHDQPFLTVTPADLADLDGDVSGCFLRLGDGYHPVPVAEAVERLRDGSMRERVLGS